jgi:hypothetical protein
MNWVKAASAAWAGVTAAIIIVSERARRIQFRAPTKVIYCIRAYYLSFKSNVSDASDLPVEICTGRSGKSMKKPKPLPSFKTEAEERKFWETHDSTDYIDWSKAERVRLPNLKPSTNFNSFAAGLA